MYWKAKQESSAVMPMAERESMSWGCKKRAISATSAMIARGRKSLSSAITMGRRSVTEKPTRRAEVGLPSVIRRPMSEL